MKRFLSILLIFLLLFSLAACGKDGEEGDSPDDETSDSSSEEESSGEEGDEEPPEPVVQYTARNPLTGEYNMADDNVGSHVVATIVSNYRYARWQSGISKADCIVETESEDHTTQLLCLFSDIRSAGAIGPVEMPFNQLSEVARGLDAAIVHYGYPKNYPYDFLKDSGYATLDGEAEASLIYIDEKRHEDYILEYSRYTDGARIAAAMEVKFPKSDSERETAFRFGDGKVTPSSGVARIVDIPFTSFYDVDLRFNAETGKYEKWQFNFIHTDKAANDKQLDFENAFILFAKFDNITDSAGITQRLVDVDYAAGGSGYWFSGGYYQEINWKKPTDSDFFSFYDKSGNELLINTGKSYIAVVDIVAEERLNIKE